METAERDADGRCGGDERKQARQSASEAVLYCVFGNPFRPPPAVDAACVLWDGGMIPKLAQAAYEHRDPTTGTLDSARLKVLADALLDAGCDEVLVTHLQDPGPHWRGCFALDALLGKS